MRNKVSVEDYLYFLSVKYEIGFENLFRGLVHARENSEVSCGKLVIQCRQKARDHEVFLITYGYKVVAQFLVPKYLLDNPNQIAAPTISPWLNRLSKRSNVDKTKRIGDLRCGMKKINLKARVLDIPKAALVFTRFGEYARVSNALIADETGTIKLCLWNEKIKSVSIDSIVQIRNASVARFRGENQLRLGRSARLSVIGETNPPILWKGK